MPLRATVLPQPDPGHAILRITDLDAPADGLALSLQRQQGPDSHLADDGWRRTEAWLVPAHVERVTGALEFHLGPEICDRLAGTATVRLRIKEPDIGVVGSTVIAWPQMLTSGAVDPSARSTDDLVRLRRPALKIETPKPVEPEPEPELPPPLVIETPEVPLRATEPAAPPPSRSNTGTWLLTIVLLILIAGGAYAYFFHREEIETLIAGTPPPAAPPATTATAAATPPPVPEPAPVPAKPPAPEPPKKSSRLAIADYLATKPAPEALLARGKEYAQGGDLREAFLVWRAAAEAGNPQAEIEVASFYDPLMQAKAGFTLDGARAADWYERAALAGNAEAQRKYGLLLAKGGAGLPADPAKAKDWLKQAAAQNDAEAKKALDAMPK